MFRVPSAGRTWSLRRQRRAESITDAKPIRNAILCPGRDLPLRNVRNVALIWSKKAINCFAPTNNAVTVQAKIQNRIIIKKIENLQKMIVILTE